MIAGAYKPGGVGDIFRTALYSEVELSSLDSSSLSNGSDNDNGGEKMEAERSPCYQIEDTITAGGSNKYATVTFDRGPQVDTVMSHCSDLEARNDGDSVIDLGSTRLSILATRLRKESARLLSKHPCATTTTATAVASMEVDGGGDFLELEREDISTTSSSSGWQSDSTYFDEDVNIDRWEKSLRTRRPISRSSSPSANTPDYIPHIKLQQDDGDFNGSVGSKDHSYNHNGLDTQYPLDEEVSLPTITDEFNTKGYNDAEDNLRAAGDRAKTGHIKCQGKSRAGCSIVEYLPHINCDGTTQSNQLGVADAATTLRREMNNGNSSTNNDSPIPVLGSHNETNFPDASSLFIGGGDKGYIKPKKEEKRDKHDIEAGLVFQHGNEELDLGHIPLAIIRNRESCVIQNLDQLQDDGTSGFLMSKQRSNRRRLFSAYHSSSKAKLIVGSSFAFLIAMALAIALILGARNNTGDDHETSIVNIPTDQPMNVSVLLPEQNMPSLTENTVNYKTSKTLPSDQTTASNTMVPIKEIQTPSRAPRVVKIIKVVSGNLVDDLTTAQGKALTWMLDSDELIFPTEDERIIQRYVMAVLHYSLEEGGSIEAMGGENRNHGKVFPPLSTRSECEWSLGIWCNNEGIIHELNFANLGLSGHLPSEISLLKNLAHLNLRSNAIWGTIPKSVGNLDKLAFLDLSLNKISGVIPTTIIHMKNLIHLELHDNILSGEIPTRIGRLKQLIQLSLDGNELDGDIPESLGDLHALQSLKLDSNRLEGTIPVSIGKLSQLQSLKLFRNVLKGPIPESIGKMHNLTELHLYRNELSGNIPPSLGKLTRLKFLSLFENMLTGPIPTAMGNMKRIKSASFDSNNLNGTMPEDFCQLRQKNLEFLSADCGGDWPEIHCSCCTECFSR